MKIFALAFLLAFFLQGGLFAPSSQARDYVPVGSAGVKLPARQSSGVARKLTAKPPSSLSSPSRTYVTPTGKIKLFGTVEFGKPISSLPIWLDVLKRNADDPIFQLTKHFNKSVTWAKLKERLEGKSTLEQLRLVNSFWNGWPYKEDPVNWGKQDYWAIPAEFLVKSGDCEDYAIVKYFTLKELGVDPQSMRLVILRDTVRNLSHAVLAVYLNNDVYILDNVSNSMLSHKSLGNYAPQYSVNEFGRWAHIVPKNG